MEYLENKLKLFEFDCPFDHLDQRNERDLFSAILHLRKQGYLSRHQYGVLPTDTYDFIGKHYGVMTETNEGLEILMSYRTITLARCSEFKLALPIENIFKGTEALEHLNLLEKIKTQSVQENKPLVYTSSWTVSPKLRKNPKTYEHVYQLLTTMNVHSFHEDLNQIKLACGSLRLKTHEYIQWLGYELFKDEAKNLNSFKQYNLNNEDVVALRLTKHSDDSIEVAEKFKIQWKNRLIFNRPILDQFIKKAA